MTSQNRRRPQAEKTLQMRVPVSMVEAVSSLKRLSSGEFSNEDIAVILIAINTAPGVLDAAGGVIGSPHDEINRMRRNASHRIASGDDTGYGLLERADELLARCKEFGI